LFYQAADRLMPRADQSQIEDEDENEELNR